MAGVPILNPALRVEAVGFRPWQAHWLGVLVTPWFMNLLLMPRLESAHWSPVAEGETRTLMFPAGVFEFIGGHEPAVGDYQACSLFSPMFEFADHGGALATAEAVLKASCSRPPPWRLRRPSRRSASATSSSAADERPGMSLEGELRVGLALRDGRIAHVQLAVLATRRGATLLQHRTRRN